MSASHSSIQEATNSLKALGVLLLAFNPAAAFNLEYSRAGLALRNPAFACRTTVSIMSTADFREVWLNPLAVSEPQPLGSLIQKGDVVLSVPDMISEPELKTLLAAGMAARDAQRERSGGDPATGRYRFSVADPTAFPYSVVLKCEEILLRVLDWVDEQIPSVYETLFEPSEEWALRQPFNAQGEQPSECPPPYLAETCPTLRDLFMAGELEWSEGEPAINVYNPSGYFGSHKDHLALTVLIPLTSQPEHFSGSGTGFWRGNRDVDENPQDAPTTILTPPAGTALLWGGDVTHAGMPVESGVRSTFVASFSTRTAASCWDRVQGLQCSPSSFTLREATVNPETQDILDQGFANLRDAGRSISEKPMEKVAVEKKETELTDKQNVPVETTATTDRGAAASAVHAADDGQAGKQDVAPKRSVKERMLDLKALFAAGLMTQDEYEQKRAEILQSL